jgi:hypothetical protein
MKLWRDFLGEGDTLHVVGQLYTVIPGRCKKNQVERRKTEVRRIIYRMYKIPGTAGTRIIYIVREAEVGFWDYIEYT